MGTKIARQTATQLALNEAQERLRLQLVDKGDQAVQILQELMLYADNENVRLNAALKLLALIGVGEVKKSETQVNVDVDMGVDQEVYDMLDRLSRNQAAAQGINLLEIEEYIPEAEIVTDDDSTETVPVELHREQ